MNQNVTGPKRAWYFPEHPVKIEMKCYNQDNWVHHCNASCARLNGLHNAPYDRDTRLEQAGTSSWQKPLLAVSKGVQAPTSVFQRHTWATRPGDQMSRLPTSVKAPPRATHARDAATMPVAQRALTDEKQQATALCLHSARNELVCGMPDACFWSS